MFRIISSNTRRYIERKVEQAGRVPGLELRTQELEFDLECALTVIDGLEQENRRLRELLSVPKTDTDTPAS